GGFGEVVVERHLFALLLHRARVLVMEILDRVHHPLSLHEQRLTERLDVDDTHARSRRRPASAESIPCSSTTLSGLAAPPTSEISSGARPSVHARRRRSALLARPSSGAAATRTFHASPWRPTISLRLAPGETRSRSRVVSAIIDQV